MDKWLAWMTTMRTGSAKDGLRVVIVEWPEDDPDWEEYFLEFRRAGGELRREAHDYEYWNPMMIAVEKRVVTCPEMKVGTNRIRSEPTLV